MAKILYGTTRPAVEHLVGLNSADFLFERSELFFSKLDWTSTCSEQCYINTWSQVISKTRRFHEQGTTLNKSDGVGEE